MAEPDKTQHARRDGDAPPGTPPVRLPLPTLLNRIAMAVLAAGLLAAALIFVTAGPDAPDLLEDDAARRQYEFELEKIGGKAAVLAADVANWFSSLWHGRTLAWTVAVLSLVIAAVCAWLAREIALHGGGGPDEPQR